jgi:hypothetical protein
MWQVLFLFNKITIDAIGGANPKFFLESIVGF